MSFHFAYGVGVGEGGERGGVSRERATLRRLAEDKEVMSKGPRLINGEGVTQGRPFGGFLAAQVESQFLPLSEPGRAKGWAYP